MSKWMIANKGADFEGIARKFNISPITARLIANRLITSREFEKNQCTDEKIEAYLNAGIDKLHDPSGMADMEKGAQVMYDRIQAGARIRVIGDYDVDGICSSYILLTGIKMFGGDVDCVLPDRMKDGYGLSIKLVDDAHAAGIDTIITCDNGIAAAEQIAHAKELGMTVVVTDHHEVPFEASGEEGSEVRKEILPPADAVIDPKRSEGNYPFKEICGAVVAYKFLQVLAKKYSTDKDAYKDFFTEMLIFAGIATVCDVMELRDENRIIVKESLRLIAHTRNKGLRALIHVNSLDENKITVYHYGFVVGPCLNATGRLELATRALALFNAESENESAIIAEDLKNLNDSRKDLTKEGVDQATELVEKAIAQEGMPKVIVAYLPTVHESIAGIIAGKIKEKYYRPTIILTEASDGGAKGSGRSIEKFDMFEELSACKDLFTKFGGHKMAAGLSLPKENIDELRRRLNENCTLEGDDFEPVIHIDIAMPLKFATMDLVREFSRLEPFGNGNSKPLFAHRNVSLLSGRILGKNKNCGKYIVLDEDGNRYEMMYFGNMEKWHQFLAAKYGQSAVDELYNGMGNNDMKINIAYYPDINSYMGRDSLQIIMNDYC
ncbi:single-stranded-DNA-specific exonuclease RecJ [Butyrivibrio sp. MC2021]|uniref:single-stranded-DNA-specific exonuclease RecJ n=1 Tax=Butyrivibrio sp. MC2021 TaxID=1408306 RepID=UPI00047E9404|nr:single-stranded-DNA-specific exonuclease RecJ [Butyrivibrio sp. MC2021]